MRRFASGTAGDGLVDNYPAPLPAQVVELKLPEVKRILGIDFAMDSAMHILRTLEFQADSVNSDTLRAVVPAHRLDVQEGPADLMEELVRIHGYDRLPDTMLADRLPRQQTNAPLAFRRTGTCGILDGQFRMQEVITYALTVPEKEAPIVGASDDYVRLKNPISSERTVMRRSLLAGVLEVTAHDIQAHRLRPLFRGRLQFTCRVPVRNCPMSGGVRLYVSPAIGVGNSGTMPLK